MISGILGLNEIIILFILVILILIVGVGIRFVYRYGKQKGRLEELEKRINEPSQKV